MDKPEDYIRIAMSIPMAVDILNVISVAGAAEVQGTPLPEGWVDDAAAVAVELLAAIHAARSPAKGGDGDPRMN